MLTVKVKLSIDDIIGALDDLDQTEKDRLQMALLNLQYDGELLEALKEAQEDVRAGRVEPHDEVMREMRAKYYR